jgi:hypothetical protein
VNSSSIARFGLGVLAAAVLTGLTACASRSGTPSASIPAPGSVSSATPASATPAEWKHPVLAAAEMPGRGDAEVWSQSCSRCHNLREPSYYTPGQWTLVMQQMRVRGYLTGEEARRVTAFLKDAGR